MDGPQPERRVTGIGSRRCLARQYRGSAAASVTGDATQRAEMEASPPRTGRRSLGLVFAKCADCEGLRS